jgi:hypothetical protein
MGELTPLRLSAVFLALLGNRGSVLERVLQGKLYLTGFIGIENLTES